MKQITLTIVALALAGSAIPALAKGGSGKESVREAPAREGKANEGRGERSLGRAGELLGAGAGGVAGAAAGAGPFGAGVAGTAGSMAGREAGESAGRAVDRHAESLKSSGYRTENDPRYDIRELFRRGD